MTFRVRNEMVEKLKASAKERDLTVSEEVERCLMFKFDFARDSHDELVMKSIKSAFDMAEQLAGARWFESTSAAQLCNAAIKNAADLLMLGLRGEDNKASEIDDAGVAIGSMAVNRTAGFGLTEARLRYDAAVTSYKHFDRERYRMSKSLSGEGLPLDWATRPLTPEEFATFQSDGSPQASSNLHEGDVDGNLSTPKKPRKRSTKA